LEEKMRFFCVQAEADNAVCIVDTDQRNLAEKKLFAAQ